MYHKYTLGLETPENNLVKVCYGTINSYSCGINVHVYTLWPFGFRIHVYKLMFSVFFFFFFCPHLLILGDNFYCYEQCIHCAYTVHVLKNIKNRSHDTIYTFKYYFATVFSVFSFQFSATISLIKTHPLLYISSMLLLTIGHFNSFLSICITEDILMFSMILMRETFNEEVWKNNRIFF